MILSKREKSIKLFYFLRGFGNAETTNPDLMAGLLNT